MNIKSAKSCFAATLFVCIFGRTHLVDNKRSADDETVGCGLNNVLKGGVCTGCPIGSHGINCSLTCKPPAYGHLCSKECECSNASCHYINGCNTSSITYEFDKSTAFSRMFPGNISITPEIPADRDTKDANPRKGANNKLFIIISSGTVIFVLLLLIGREVFKLHRTPENPGNSHILVDAFVADNIYNEIL